jgi:ATP-dependent DNA helicase RecQ
MEPLERVWGYTSLRPLQWDAIAATVAGRDSLVVLPTGGGKSLCYQLPPLVSGRPALVVSPLIALMKDQVDSLTLVGYPAAALNSTVEADEARRAWADIDAGRLRLLFVSPERLFSPSFLARLVKSGIRTIAIDEAHCISQWGHDFRPEYRRLRELREVLPDVQINAYTATATPAVRADIIGQLGLRDPAELVGVFDRPNLTYRVLPKMDPAAQAAEAIRRHPGSASIVYCISRKETESLADELTRRGLAAKAYHAGLSPDVRHDIQDDFANERLDIVVATVAFGMGIDRSDVRCVVHAGLPKSVEHYQQETGRAGRDGLPSECVMLYSAADAVRWTQLFARSVEGGEASPEWQREQRRHLEEMQRFCTAATCRHRLLSEYFGQAYTPPSPGEAGPAGCGACDVCLGEVEEVDGALVIAQKILSAVARAGMTRRHDGSPASFGASHIVGILKGSDTKAIREWGHDRLSTFGLLREMPKEEIGGYLNQLADQGFLARGDGPFPTVHVTEAAREVFRGSCQVRLGRAKAIAEAPARGRRRGEAVGDPGLFEALRALRKRLAGERGVPPYVVFSDAVLQELAAARPTRPETMLAVKGVGERKLAEFGRAFAEAIAAHAAAHGLSTDGGPQAPAPRAAPNGSTAPALSANQERARPLLEQGRPVAEVAAAIGLAPSTVSGYLVELVDRGVIRGIDPWVTPGDQDAIAQAARRLGDEGLRRIHDHFAGRYSYEQIRLTLIHKAGSPAGTTPRG